MKQLVKLTIALAIACFYFSQASAQSAVYVYKNQKTGEGDYMVISGMPSEEDAEFLAQEKLKELGYPEELLREYASTSNKGWIVVIKSVFQNRYGKSATLYGAAVGAKTQEQAEKDAVANLKRFNQEWIESTPYTLEYEYQDK